MGAFSLIVVINLVNRIEMQHRLQLFYLVVAFLSALALAGTGVLHAVPNWVKFPEENGTPTYGLWKAGAEFPNDAYLDSGKCRRYWDERWKREAELVHPATKAAASFFIFGMFFNLILFFFVLSVALCASKVDFYPGVPVTLAAITMVMYAVGCSVMEWVVKWRLIHDAENHNNLPRNAPRDVGPAAYGGWVCFGCMVANFFLGILILVFKPTKEEIQQKFELQFTSSVAT